MPFIRLRILRQRSWLVPDNSITSQACVASRLISNMELMPKNCVAGRSCPDKVEKEQLLAPFDFIAVEQNLNRSEVWQAS